MKVWPARSVIAFLVLAILGFVQGARAQATTQADPENAAPRSTAQPTASSANALPDWPPSEGGIFERFREDLSKPLSTKKKFIRAIEQSIFPGLLGTAFGTGLGMATDARLNRDYGMGAKGFLRRWTSDIGENATGIFVGDFGMASLLHQDPRYHPEKRRGFGRRLGHALEAVVVTRSDSGQNEFNSSHLAGLLAGAGAATAWHHASDRSWGFFGERFGTELIGSATYNVLAEFLFYRKEPRN